MSTTRRAKASVKLAVFVLTVGAGLVCVDGAGADIFYMKEFFLDRVDANAPIVAGGVAETWASKEPEVKLPTLVVKAGDPAARPPVPAVTLDYVRALVQTSQNKINKGFPISATGNTVDSDPNKNGIAFLGNIVTSDGLDHTAMNVAIATLSVQGRKAVGPRVLVRQPGGGTVEKLLTDSVRVGIVGSAAAGKPTDGDRVHSADSFVGVEIKAKNTFQVVGGGDKPTVEAISRNVMTGGRFDPTAIAKGEVLDPYFVTLTDLDTNTATVELVMLQDLLWSDALFQVDDTGIRLTINRNDPESFVSLLFSSSTSSWVLDPYTYFARLDRAGLSASGLTPLSGRTVTMTSDTVEAFFPFGSEGQPYDDVLIRPPDSLFAVDHVYTYDIGASEGAFDISAVPQTASLTLTLGGLAVLAARCGVTRWRSRPSA